MRKTSHPARRTGRRAAPRQTRGVVLLEALVGILIFTIGVLGLVGVQAAMTTAQTAANYRAEAAQLASDLVARVWLDGANRGSYTSAAKCKSHEPCADWMKRVAARLPGGVDPTLTEVDGRLDIVITWVVPGDKDDAGKHSFRTSTSLNI